MSKAAIIAGSAVIHRVKIKVMCGSDYVMTSSYNSISLTDGWWIVISEWLSYII